MKTKIYLFSALIGVLLFSLDGNAGWYNPHTVAISGTKTNCDEDGFLNEDVTGPNDASYIYARGDLPGYSETLTLGRKRQAQVIRKNTNPAYIECQYWDATPPTAISISYPTGWDNSNKIRVTMTASDAGGAGIMLYRLQYRYSDSSPNFTAGWTGWANVTPDINSTLNNVVYDFDTVRNSPGRAYQFRFQVRDFAGNWSAVSSTPATPYKFDSVDPDPNLFSPAVPTANNANLVANANQTLTFRYTGNGSPVGIDGDFENNTNPNVRDPVTIPIGVYALSNRDISNVQTDFNGFGGRQITFTLNKVRDEAGNEKSTTRTFTWNVYADKLSAVTSQVGSFGSYVADGQWHPLTLRLQDKFGNPIIYSPPTTGINRRIGFTLRNVSNTVFLNQYSRGGGSAVFIATGALVERPLTTTIGAAQGFGTLISRDGNYPFYIKSYTPTVGGYSNPSTDAVSDPNADFRFDSELTISNDSIQAGLYTPATVPSPSFVFSPLFTTNIAGDLLDGGFIEGTQQNSVIAINQNGGSPNAISGNALYFVFSGSTSSVSQFMFQAGSTGPNVTYSAGVIRGFTTAPAFGGAGPIVSQLTQTGNTVSRASDLSLSTHLGYILDRKTIVTNSMVLGRIGGYYGINQSGLATQVGVKVLGSFSSKNSSSIITNQFATGVSMFGNVNRGTLRESVKKNIALAIRNATLTGIVGTITDTAVLPTAGAVAQGVKINQSPTQSIMYIQKTGGNIVMSASAISGVRTLVIKGANLYITSDMYYANKESLLGVVLQKDALGNGGNLYIDPSITNLVGAYVIDGSIISYDGTTELGYNTAISVLKNQLYLFGSISSENTIGGSRQSPPRCPSLITTGCSATPTIAQAQKYDLNYLRRYYLFGGAPFGNAKVIGGETCTTATCTAINSNLTQKFLTPADDLAKYPFIVEFNPYILRKQPTGFENIVY